MGKPYASELARLSETYLWAIRENVDRLVGAVGKAAAYPLVTIGSGGSLTAAFFAAALHERLTGQAARACTPLEVVSSDPGTIRRSAIVLLSASGKNSDILAAARSVLQAEPPLVAVLTATPKSPLALEVKDYAFAEVVELGLPTNGDGFLATNSLLAFAVLLYRAYREVVPLDPPLPDTLERLLGKGFERRVRVLTSGLWTRSTLLVLHGLVTKPAALDLESKFTEAALGNVQPTDFRNFAHGRHHWLAKHAASTAVLALVARQDEKLAGATLRLLPKSIPVARFAVSQDGMLSSLAALVYAMYIVREAGRARGLDPGRPGVPEFGRRLYALRTIRTLSTKSASGARELMEMAILRKADASLSQLVALGELEAWKDAYRAFVANLTAATFRGLVLDYDGTLVAERDRFVGPDSDTLSELVRLLSEGVPVGVATGRGKSVGQQLRALVPRELWERVLIGYYNGSEVAFLHSEHSPSGAPGVCVELAEIADAIEQDAGIKRYADVTCRHRQITLQPRASFRTIHVWEVVHELLLRRHVSGVQVVRSGHSVDVLPPGVTKLGIVAQLRSSAGLPEGTPVLCIGDRGRWPGNDVALLSEFCALSVNEVSHDPVTCWNLAPPGYRGVLATRHYLRAIRVSKDSSFKMRLGVPAGRR